MKPPAIMVSAHSGFCFGVRRALDIAARALKKGKKVYSLGPIIHNPQVVAEFLAKGLKIIKDIRSIGGKKAVFLIPSHGISPGAKTQNAEFIDTTCPLVARVQNIVKTLKDSGHFIVIVGNKSHPEVKGLKGIAGPKSCVVKNKAEAKALRIKSKKVALISQTTSALSDFKDVFSVMAKKNFTELASFNTVCKNTIDRQHHARLIAKKVGAMIIIGGRSSANTSKLAASCKEVNKNTYHIESGRDLKIKVVKGKNKVGIATGASTPPYAIREVVKKIKGVQ